MKIEHDLHTYVGRWTIRAATRPAAWPFLCAAEIEIQAAGDGRLYLRVRTTGGALLRGYTLAWRPDEHGIVVSGLESNGHDYDLALARPGGLARPHLVAVRVDPATGVGGGEGGWTAVQLDARAGRVAA